MVQQHEITLKSYPRGFHLITDEVLSQVGKLPKSGLMHIFIKHTSAGLTLNENADPSVRADLESSFNKLVPENEPYYTHTFEGSDDMPAHIKSSLVGSSVSIPILDYKLNIGVWQGITLCEFRTGQYKRRIVVTIIS